MATNSFNLIDEKWIPTVDKGLVSLKQVFSDREIKQLGGSVIEKLSIFKLYLQLLNQPTLQKMILTGEIILKKILCQRSTHI